MIAREHLSLVGRAQSRSAHRRQYRLESPRASALLALLAEAGEALHDGLADLLLLLRRAVLGDSGERGPRMRLIRDWVLALSGQRERLLAELLAVLGRAEVFRDRCLRPLLTFVIYPGPTTRLRGLMINRDSGGDIQSDLRP